MSMSQTKHVQGYSWQFYSQWPQTGNKPNIHSGETCVSISGIAVSKIRSKQPTKHMHQYGKMLQT